MSEFVQATERNRVSKTQEVKKTNERLKKKMCLHGDSSRNQHLKKIVENKTRKFTSGGTR